MSNFCPKCNSPIANGSAVCAACGYTPNDNHPDLTDAEALFLSGSAYLSLGSFDKAAEQFLSAATLSPTDPKGWLYLLAAITERFRVLYIIADERSKRRAGKHKVVCESVYKNFVATATDDDYIFAKSEFGIDLDPRDEELWECILQEIIKSEPSELPLGKASELAHVAVRELKRSHPQTAKRYFSALCEKLNPIHDGVLEVNTLEYYPDSPDRLLRIKTEADSIEFVSDQLDGSDRYDSFLLTKGIEYIGTSYPLAELTVDEGVTEIPPKLLCFCKSIEIVHLSSTVRVIGKSAFTECVNLRSIHPLDSVEEIRDGAFFGTSIRYLDLPSGMKKLGSDIIGARTCPTDAELARSLIKLDAALAESSPNFNRIGDHRCGYVLRSEGKLKLVYPMKTVDGKNRSLSHSDRSAFKTLAYSSVELK